MDKHIPHDTTFVAALGLVRKKATLQGLELQCFAFLSQDAVNRRDFSWAGWWMEGVCPQICYDQGLSAREKAVRLGVSNEILDLATKTESGGSAASDDGTAPDTEEPEGKGVAAFLLAQAPAGRRLLRVLPCRAGFWQEQVTN